MTRAQWCSHSLKKRSAETIAPASMTPPGLLSGDELAKRLARFSPDLVEEVAKVAKDALAGENGRESSLNGKATSLLTASGLSLTVAFTFGGMLLQHPEYLDPLSGGWAATVAFLYGAALLSGLAATGWALGALFVTSKYVGISESNVFDPAVFAESDRLDFESQNGGKEKGAPPVQAVQEGYAVEDPPPFPKSGTAYFRRFMTAHLWQIYQEHFRIHRAKAKRIWKGQVFFGLFLVALATLGLILAWISLAQQRERRAPKTVQASIAAPPAAPIPSMHVAVPGDAGVYQVLGARAPDAGTSSVQPRRGQPPASP